MIVTPIHTKPVLVGESSLEVFLDTWITELFDHEVIVVTSKVISIFEGSVIQVGSADKDALVETEADYYLDRTASKYGFCISIKNNTLIASAGIDESNGNGHYVLWPKDPQASANFIREYLCTKFHVTEIGVIITDSHVLPLRWGTVGTTLAHSGFKALNSYIGKPDIFGRSLKATNANISEGLAAASVVVMGEGNECTPLARISDISFVQFETVNPTPEEVRKLHISIEEDIFAPFLLSVPWKQSKR